MGLGAMERHQNHLSRPPDAQSLEASPPGGVVDLRQADSELLARAKREPGPS
ncbi:hypothetical protein THTE_2536 [Thermogutta terrifontis]|uniref:Uncharacterized protein n=1 Tax=Thermogutta terrifontis TaxID=1331910 RepID=A0A286RGQ5_9BACT|nr:hypothetical protein THTE_2536 [Thermogutta terrifontis]